MDENVNEFLWQMVIVGLMISAFGIFMILNQGINTNFDIVNADISDQRVLITDVTEIPEATLSGASILYQIYSGLEVSIQVEGVLYKANEDVAMPPLSLGAVYKPSYVIDMEGALVQINYERVYL